MSEKEENGKVGAQWRPDRTTMRGMLWNANHVLDSALDPKTNGVPRSFFEMCRGVVLVSVVEAGFIFSGNVGTGVVLSRDRRTGRWSPPSAVGLAGVGFGFLMGADVKDVIIVLMDDMSMKALAGSLQIKFGAQLSLTVGPVGREVEGQLNLSDYGPGTAFAYSFSKGLFGGVSFEGAVLTARSKENERFYGKDGITPSDILFEEGAVDVPEDSGITDLWEKLELMQAGKTKVPTPIELEKKESMRVEAEEAGQAAKAEQGDSVQYVKAEEEAVKEEKIEEKTEKEVVTAEEEGAKKEEVQKSGAPGGQGTADEAEETKD